MFLVLAEGFRSNCVDRESTTKLLNEMKINGMEATRDAIDDGKTEYWSETFGFVTIECTVSRDMRSEVFA